MIKSDFHVHSEYSTDSDAPFESQIDSAFTKGIEHLCFTEHMDIGFPGGEFIVDMESYRAAYEKNKDNGRVNLYFGIELGLKNDITDELRQFVQNNSLDFIIGSIHLVDNIDVYEPEYFEGHDEKERYRHYFEVTLENIKKFHDFDVLGHLDYISRCGELSKTYSYEPFADIIDEILKTLISNGNGIEVNTGPYKKGLNRPNPCLDIIKRYRELGGEIITIGSDAHTPAYIANNFPSAEHLLRLAGFQHYCIFQNRRPVYIRLK